MSPKLGILVKDLAPSQLSYYLIRNTNKLLASRPDTDIIAFYETMAPPCIQPAFATMHLSEAWAFPGSLIATSLSTAEKLIRFPSAQPKFFYVWDLEWLRLERKAYRPLQAIYGCQHLHLLARSKDHAELIGRCWNHQAGVVEDLDMEQLEQEMSFV